MWLLMSLASSTNRKFWPSARCTRQDRYDGSIGRQWPPTPGPGVNRMNPNGLVDAASIACQTSMPRSCENIAISLTSAMLTCRKVFSSSLASSASRGRETGHGGVHDACRRTPGRPSSDAASMPETTFGVLTRFQVGLPGSMRSGL